MLKFISFGSGSSGNCYYLFTETDGLLIDSGIGVRALKKGFSQKGLRMDMVHNILVTHDHADHIKSVGNVSAENDIPVYSTRVVHDGIHRNFYVHTKVPPKLVRYLEKDVTTKIGEFIVTPFDVPHDSADNVGYCVEFQGVIFCIITDIGEITTEIRRYIGKAQYLVIESNHDEQMVISGKYPDYLKKRILGNRGHLSNANCGLALAENMKESLRQVWLCHLSEENNHPELARKTVETILRSHGIVPGKDIKLEVLGRKTPSYIFTLSP